MAWSAVRLVTPRTATEEQALAGSRVADLAFDQEDLGGVREAQSFGCGADLDGAQFVAAVRDLLVGVADRDGLPVERVEGVEQGGLVAHGVEDVERVAFVQVGGVGALGVHGVGGDRHAGDVDGVEQRGERFDLVGLRWDLALAGYGAGVVAHGRDQVRGLAAGVFRAAYGLAVHAQAGDLGRVGLRRRRAGC